MYSSIVFFALMANLSMVLQSGSEARVNVPTASECSTHILQRELE